MSEIWNSGVLLVCGGTFDLVVFKVILVHLLRITCKSKTAHRVENGWRFITQC